MKKLKRKYKIWLIALSTPILIYFIWGYFGFAGAWIPGTYNVEKKQYKAFWGLGDNLIFYNNGTFRIAGYTPELKQGLIDTTGKVVIPFLYKKVEQRAALGENLYVITNKSNRKGIINNTYETIIPMEYDAVNSVTSDFNFLMLKNGNFALLDKNGKEILPAKYSNIFMPFDKHRQPFLIASQGTYSNLIFPDGIIIKKDYLITDATYPDGKNNLIIFGVKTADLDRKLWNIESLVTQESSDLGKIEKDKNLYISINNSNPIKQWFALYDEKGNEILPFEFDNIDWLVQGINWKKQEVVRVKKMENLDYTTQKITNGFYPSIMKK